MAPVDGGAQRALPGRGGPVAGGEQAEPVGPGARRSAQRTARGPALRPARWPAARRPAPGRPRRRPPRCAGDGESRAGRRRPGRRTAAPPRSRESPAIGRPRPARRRYQRRHLPDGFSAATRSGSRLVTRTRSPGAAGEQPLAEPGARVDQVLAVVQRQQHAVAAQRRGQRVQQRPRPSSLPRRGPRPPGRRPGRAAAGRPARLRTPRRGTRPRPRRAAAAPAGSCRCRPRRTG